MGVDREPWHLSRFVSLNMTNFKIVKCSQLQFIFAPCWPPCGTPPVTSGVYSVASIARTSFDISRTWMVFPPCAFECDCSMSWHQRMSAHKSRIWMASRWCEWQRVLSARPALGTMKDSGRSGMGDLETKTEKLCQSFQQLLGWKVNVV